MQIVCDLKDSRNQSDMSAVIEQSNEISKTNGMSETDKEWLATDWERSDHGRILCFRILYEERNRIFNRVAYLSDFQKRRQEKLPLREKYQ